MGESPRQSVCPEAEVVKIPHKINHGFAPDRTDPAWAERVEREALHDTARAEHAYARAKRRYESALLRAQREDRPRANKRRVRDLWARVEARRDELKQVEALLGQTPAGSQHRGKGSYRGVATGEAL